MNHNQLLGVSHDATKQEIQTAFRKKALEHHPDVSVSLEAAEAFMRIKEARDALIRNAPEQNDERDEQAIQRATDAALRATAQATHQTTTSQSIVDDLYDGMTTEEITYIQTLDRLAMAYAKHGRLKRTHESDEVKKHHKKIATNNKRLSGKY